MNFESTNIEEWKEFTSRLEDEIMKKSHQIAVLKNEITELEAKVINTKNEMMLDNITNINTFKNLLIPYTTEAMTHREKAYMGEKITLVLNVMLQNMKSEYLPDANLPF